jgi:hypothetical protein
MTGRETRDPIERSQCEILNNGRVTVYDQLPAGEKIKIVGLVTSENFYIYHDNEIFDRWRR